MGCRFYAYRRRPNGLFCVTYLVFGMVPVINSLRLLSNRQVFFVFLALFFLFGGILLWFTAPSVQQALLVAIAFVGDASAIQEFVNWLGWFGPLFLIFLNALQIVVAPLPAYAIFAAAGFLYGGFWGGLYGTIGTLIGASVAMLLTRRFGRLLAARMVGADRLDRWNEMTEKRSLLVWGLLLLAPVGDLPFFLAGLSRVSVMNILILTTITRIPSIFLIATAASGTSSLTWRELVPIMIVLIIGCGLLWRYQEALLAWFDQQVHRRLPVTKSQERSQIPDNS
jgi:uncharacterized membrane protein YdjX (TVP38/TMEM64 family)